MLSWRLKKLRMALKKTQREMAESLDIAVSTYQYYERGERDVPGKVLVKIASSGISPSWLLTGQSGMFSSPTSDKRADPIETSGNVRTIPDPRMKYYYKHENDPDKRPVFEAVSGFRGKGISFDDFIRFDIVNYKLIKDIIVALDEFILKTKTELESTKKAELITVLYEQFMNMRGDFDPGTFERFMRAIKN